MKPTIEILIGAPLRGSEASFLRKIHNDLESHGSGPCLILANFEVPSGSTSCQIDFVVVALNRTELVELKCFGGRVFGDQNGLWQTEDHSGILHDLQGCNPWEQARDAKLALNDAMHVYRKRHWDVPVPIKGKFFDFDATVCIYPQIQAGSKVTTGNFKAWVSSYPEVFKRLTGRPLPSSWQQEHWKRFAIDYLHLSEVSLEEAVDPRVNTASYAVRAYLDRLERALSQNLAPLLAATDDECCGQNLVTLLLGPKNYFLIGPSGLGKTFHFQHLARQAASHGEVPILIETRYYAGDLNRALHKSISPFTDCDPGSFLDSVKLCGMRPVLLLDGLNEVRDRLAPDLRKDLLAIQLRHLARLVCASQTDTQFPGGLAFERIQLSPLRLEHQRAIYRFHAGLDSDTGIDYLCHGFRTAYDLTLAGHCHDLTMERMTRAALYDRYCSRLLPTGYPAVAGAILRHVASEMHSELVNTMSRRDYERLAERRIEETRAPFTLLDDLRRCQLLKIEEDSISFEHDLLRDYFVADQLWRQNLELDHLTSELGRPKNLTLIEFILPRITSSGDLRHILTQPLNAEQLDAAFEGRVGEMAQQIIKDDCASLFKAAIADIPNLTVMPKTQRDFEGRLILCKTEVQNHRIWSEYEGMLCGVIARHLDDPFLCRRFLEALEATERGLRRATQEAARESRLKFHPIWGELVRIYGALDGGTYALPVQRMISALRGHYRFSSQNKPPEILYNGLCESVTCEPCPDFALFCLLELAGRDSAANVDFYIELLRRAVKSGIFIVQARAIEMIRLCASEVRDKFPDKKAEIVSLLESMLPGEGRADIAGVIEALSYYDAIESPIMAEDALTELDTLMRANENGLDEKDPLVSQLGYSPDELITEQAYGWISRMFESVLEEAYWEAYKSIPAAQKMRLLCLASKTKDIRFWTTWILQEMLCLEMTNEALQVYERYASSIQSKSSSPQEATAAFVLGIEGWAQGNEEPCSLTQLDSPDWVAWNLVGQMLFWFAKLDRKDAAGKIDWLMKKLSAQSPLAAADVFYRLSDASAMYIRRDGQRTHEELMSVVPDMTRRILENSLAHRGSLTSLFPMWPAGRDTEVVLFATRELGKFGNDRSISVLKEIIDDRELGKTALEAIKQIQARSK